MWIGLAFGAGVVAAQHSTRAAALQVLLTSIEAGRGHAVRLAVAEQRQHVARDLHDSVAHAMTVVCLHAAAARSHRDDVEVVRASLATIESTVREGMDELRQGLDALDPVEGSTARCLTAEHPGGAVTAGDLGHEVEHVASTIGVTTVVDVAGGHGGAGRHGRVRGQEGRPRGARQRRPARAYGGRPGPDRRRADPAGRRGQQRGGTWPWPVGFDHGSGTGLRGLAELVHGHGGRLEHGSATDAEFRVTAYLPTTAGVPA